MKFKERVGNHFLNKQKRESQTGFNVKAVEEVNGSLNIEIQNVVGDIFFINVGDDRAKLSNQLKKILYVYEEDPPLHGDCLTLLEFHISKY